MPLPRELFLCVAGIMAQSTMLGVIICVLYKLLSRVGNEPTTRVLQLIGRPVKSLPDPTLLLYNKYSFAHY